MCRARPPTSQQIVEPGFTFRYSLIIFPVALMDHSGDPLFLPENDPHIVFAVPEVLLLCLGKNSSSEGGLESP